MSRRRDYPNRKKSATPARSSRAGSRKTKPNDARTWLSQWHETDTDPFANVPPSIDKKAAETGQDLGGYVPFAIGVSGLVDLRSYLGSRVRSVNPERQFLTRKLLALELEFANGELISIPVGAMSSEYFEAPSVVVGAGLQVLAYVEFHCVGLGMVRFESVWVS